MHSGKITLENGKWANDAQRSAFAQALRQLQDGDYRWKLTEWSESRSNLQNSYLHGAVIPLFAKEQGYTKEEAKMILKEECAKTVHYRDLEGKIKSQPQSTAAMTVQEFTDFLDEIERVFAFLGMQMPDPEEFKRVTGRKQ